MSKVLVMTFANEDGKKVSLRVRSPKEALNEQELKSAMDVVVAKNIFNSLGGNLVSVDGARIVDTETTVLMGQNK